MVNDWYIKKKKVKLKLGSIIVVVFIFIMVLAIAGGIGKNLYLKNQSSKVTWNGKDSLLVAINSVRPMLLAYQKEPKNLKLFAISPDAVSSFVDSNDTLKTVNNFSDLDGEKLSVLFSKTFGIKIDHFILDKNMSIQDADEVEKTLADFTSIVTPFKILTIGYDSTFQNTNITRLEALRLWWQIKEIRIDSIEISDLTHFNQKETGLNGRKVLGVDTISLNREIRGLTENLDVLREHNSIEVKNGSGNFASGELAASFIQSIGGNVVVVDKVTKIGDTVVLTSRKNSETAMHLANIFDCDIKDAVELDEDEIVVNLGVEFREKYY